MKREIAPDVSQHRNNRRDFLENAGKFAVGSVTAGVLFEGLTSNYASAQPAPKAVARRRPQRGAVIGAGHYHATLAPYYLKILQNDLDLLPLDRPVGLVEADRTPPADYFLERHGCLLDVSARAACGRGSAE